MPLTVALCRASSLREFFACLPQLRGHPVDVFPSLVPPRESLVQSAMTALGPASAVQTPAFSRALSRSQGVPNPLGVFTCFEKLMHARSVDGAVVMKGSISVGEAVLLNQDCRKDSPLFVVDQVFTVAGSAAVYVVISELAAKVPAGATVAEPYAANLNTHVRYVQPDTAVVVPAARVWTKVFAPSALTAAGDKVRGAVAFTAALERAGALW